MRILVALLALLLAEGCGPRAVPGVLDADTATKTINRDLYRFQDCYVSHRGDAGAGRIVVVADLDASGRVSAVQGVESELPEAVGSCLLDVFRALRFPAPDEAPYSIAYPFRFEP